MVIVSFHHLQVVDAIVESGISHVSINVASDNPKQYMDIMRPTASLKFADMCSFVVACVESGSYSYVLFSLPIRTKLI